MCENICYKSLLLILRNEKIEKNCRPSWLVNPTTGRRLEYDFYLPNCRVAFEIQGQHHYTDPYQIAKDQLKKELSLLNNVVLIELSTVQIDPIFLYRKLFNIRKHEGISIGLRKFDPTWAQVKNDVVIPYKKVIKSIYGTTEATTSPLSISSAVERKEKEKLLKFLDTVKIPFRGKEVRCQVLSETPKNVLLRILGTDTQIFYRKNKLFKLL